MEVTTITKGGRGKALSVRGLDDVDESSRRAFRAAAAACIDLGAEPREYVAAQFAKWREASAYHNKFMLPTPQHMGTVAARVRYLQHKASDDLRRSRVAVIDDQEDRARFYVENRTLRGLARVQRRDPADVLAGEPERFSRAFLEHKGVWAAVKDLWEERCQK